MWYVVSRSFSDEFLVFQDESDIVVDGLVHELISHEHYIKLTSYKYYYGHKLYYELSSSDIP